MTTNHTDLIARLRNAGGIDLVNAADEAADALEAMQAQMDNIAHLVRSMHAADENYGTGFYGQDEWLTSYRALAQAIDAARGQE